MDISEKESFQEQLDMQQKALTEIYKSVEKTRKYIFWSGVANLAMIVLPLVIVAVMLPKILGGFSSALGGAGIDLNTVSESLELLQGLQS